MNGSGLHINAVLIPASDFVSVGILDDQRSSVCSAKRNSSFELAAALERGISACVNPKVPACNSK